MKIAVLVETFPCKTEVPVLNQICGLIDAGHVVDIYALKNDDRLVHPGFINYKLKEKTHYIESNPINLSRNLWLSRLYLLLLTFPKILCALIWHPVILFNSLDHRKFGDLTKSFFLFHLAYYFKRINLKCDVLYCQFAPFGLIGTAIRECGAIDARVVTAFRGYGINVVPKIKREGYYNLLIRKGDWFTSNSLNTKMNAVKLGFPEEKIDLLHSTLLVDSFPFRERMLLPGEKLNLLSVGSLFPVKGHKYAIEAMHLLKIVHELTNFKYVIVGAGSEEDDLRSQIKNLHLTEHVELAGFIDQKEIKEYYGRAHLLIHPSVQTETGSVEAQGLVIQEAQATGLPVMASRVGGIPEGMLEGDSGYLFPEKDPEAICNLILDMLSKTDQWPAMGRAGRKYVLANFDLTLQTKKLTLIFEKLMTSDQFADKI